MATPADLITVVGAVRTYKLHDADTTLGTARNQLGRFTIVDNTSTMFAGGIHPRTYKNIGEAMMHFGKYVERHEASLL